MLRLPFVPPSVVALVRRRPLMVSLAAGLIAMMLMGAYLKRREAELMFIADPMPVIVATQDIPEGAALTDDVIALRELPRGYVQPHALRALDAARGMVTLAPVARGTQLTRAHAVMPGPESGVAVALTKGERALTIAVDDVTGVAGLILPGARVDVLGTFDFGDDAMSRKSTLTIKQSARVIAVGTRVVHEPPPPPVGEEKKGLFGGLAPAQMGARTFANVTIAASAAETPLIVLAQESGQLTLVVRPRGDDDAVNAPPATIEAITGAAGLLRQKKPSYREYRGR